MEKNDNYMLIICLNVSIYILQIKLANLYTGRLFNRLKLMINRRSFKFSHVFYTSNLE